MRKRFHLVGFVLLLNIWQCHSYAQQKRPSNARGATNSIIKIKTEQNAIVWLDDVRRGTTDGSGFLSLDKINAGRHVLRVRALGFSEKTVPLTPGNSLITVPLIRTTDHAELAFQKAEEAADKAHDDEARKAAADLYRDAIKLRPNRPAAHLGLARVLLELNDFRGALAEVTEARRYRPIYPEASAVEGRIHRTSAFMDQAIASFKRSIREAHGFEPEAHTGLALVYEDQGQYDEAIPEFRKALQQLSDTEPVLYQVLGSIYERQEKYKDAVEAYEKYLELAPNGNLAPAIQSVIDQLRKQASGEQLMPK